MTCVFDVYVVRLFEMRFCDALLFFFQAEDGIRDLVRSRGLGDVYKRQCSSSASDARKISRNSALIVSLLKGPLFACSSDCSCLLYTSDAADERSSVDLGGRRIIKKKKQ